MDLGQAQGLLSDSLIVEAIDLMMIRPVNLTTCQNAAPIRACTIIISDGRPTSTGLDLCIWHRSVERRYRLTAPSGDDCMCPLLKELDLVQGSLGRERAWVAQRL